MWGVPDQFQGPETSQLGLLEGFCSRLCHQMMLPPPQPCFRPEWANSEWPHYHSDTVQRANVNYAYFMDEKSEAQRWEEPARDHTAVRGLAIMPPCFINAFPPPGFSAECLLALPGFLLLGAFPDHLEPISAFWPWLPYPMNLPLPSPVLGRSVSGSGIPLYGKSYRGPLG